MLANYKIEGVSGSLKDGSKGIVKQTPNSNIFFGYPFPLLAHIYQLGENGGPFKGYDQPRAIAKRDTLDRRLTEKIKLTTNSKKKQRLLNKRARRLDKKNRKIKEGNQVMRWGEPLAIYNHRQSLETAKSIQQYLNAKGYFNATVEVDTTTSRKASGLKSPLNMIKNAITNLAGNAKKQVDLTYNVERRQRFYIDSIQYQIRDTILHELLAQNRDKSPLKKGFYDQGNLAAERDYLYDIAVNNGYYGFSKQYISFQVDSTLLGRDSLFVREIIKNPEGQAEHPIYYIDSVIFVSEASDRNARIRSSEVFKGITFNFAKNKYSKKILQWRIPFEQDDRYSRDLTIETQRQLSFLDNFKFVNINYDTTGNRFVANIFTSPFEKYQTSTELGVSSRSRNPGPFFNFNLKNRNTFNAFEVVNLNVSAKLEDLPSVVSDESDLETFETNYTSRQFGGELSINFPQFLFPLSKYYKKKMGRFNPQTRISFSSSYEDRLTEYTRLIYSGAIAYSWQVRNQSRYTLTPFQLNLIDSKNTSSFEETLEDLETAYANAFRSAIVSSSAMQRVQTTRGYGEGKDGSYLRLFSEIGGDLNNLFGESFFGDSLESYKFVKAEVDFRKIERITRNLNLAYRVHVGYAFPFGANNSLPYEKYFYAGGSSSIRAFEPRRLGPGSYRTFTVDDEGNETDEIDTSNEQPGEILIESSIELRQNLAGFLEGAVFLDAGNVWFVSNDSFIGSDDEETTTTSNLEDGVFRFDRFLSQTALGTGVGLRFDLQFLIFRLDLGVKLIDPAQDRGERFVGDELFRNFEESTTLNIGIGYPF